MLVSGNLPMSSADTTSTIDSDFFFAAMAVSMAARIPVTVISTSPSSGVACCATELLDMAMAAATASDSALRG